MVNIVVRISDTSEVLEMNLFSKFSKGHLQGFLIITVKPLTGPSFGSKYLSRRKIRSKMRRFVPNFASTQIFGPKR